MSNQIVITSGAKVRGLNGVLTGTSGIVSSVPLGAANGVATLDSGGKVPVSQLPSSVVTYLGTWNAATNTPTLVNGVGDAGDMYICNVAGTVNFGAGPVTFAVGDWVLYGSGTWQKSNGQNGTVTSVAITESGDSLNITGSPITTSGTINIGFNGTNLQYVNGAGNLTTFPDLTGYVPYTGATQNVDLGVFDLTADLITGARGSFASSGGSDTFAINHSSGAGIALNITKGGNGEGLYINKTSGSGNAATIIGTLEATTLVKNGGTSSQFLKADGTVDSNTYALDSLVVHLAGNETITGVKNFNLGLTLQDGYYPTPATGYVGLGSNGSGITILTKSGITVYNNNLQFSNASNSYYFPNATGTIALTSDISYPVTSVFGRTGAVVATSGDYTTAQVTEVTNLYYTDTRARLALSFAAGSGAYNSTTGVITIPTNNNQITNGAGYTTNVGTVTSVAALTLGTSGTDLSSTVANSTTTPVITLNVPTASATNRGALSSADWTTFNNKQSALTNPVTGTGTTNYLPKFTGTSTIGNSVIQEASNNIGIGHSPSYKFDINNVGGSSATARLYGNDQANVRLRLENTGGRTWELTGGLTGANNSTFTIYDVTAAATRLQIDASGNLGLGVTPSAWATVGPVIQFTAGGFIGSQNTANTFYVGQNHFYNGSNFIYNNDGFATQFQVGSGDGSFSWRVSPSGTAGNAISFTQAMTLTASGRLLINTPTESTYQLDVNGTGRFAGDLSILKSSGAYATITTDATTGVNFVFKQGGVVKHEIFTNTTQFAIYNTTTAAVALSIANATGAATFSSSVGATNFSATQSPSNSVLSTIQLTTASGTLYSANMQLNTSGGLDTWTYNATNGWQNRMTLTTGGNIGINTTSPQTKLHITTTGMNLASPFTYSSSSTGITLESTLDTSGYGSALFFDNGGIKSAISGIRESSGNWGTALGFYTHPTTIANQNELTERMRITSGGNVLIGSTDDGSGSKVLSYSTSAATQFKAAGTAPAITFTNTITGASYGGVLGACTSANQFISGTSAGDMVLANQFSGYRLYAVAYSGGVYLTSGATSWTANSDIRLKNINSYIENAVEKLSTLQTINFSYKDDKTNKQNLGLIAQEVEKIFPELIDKNGDGMLGVRYTELVPVLIKAVQELKLEIETLKNK